MKKFLKLLFVLVCILLLPNLVNAKEIINTITVKNVTVPVVGEKTKKDVVIDTTGLKTSVVQWQTENGSVLDEDYLFVEGTTYMLYVEFTTDEGYEVSENANVKANVETKESVYNGTNWVGLYFTTPGKGNNHTISFVSNWEEKIEDLIISDGDIFVMPAFTDRDGYIFDGWYEDEALTIEFDINSRVYEDKTLYAKWIEKKSLNVISTINIKGVTLPLGEEVPSSNAYVDTKGLKTNTVQWQTLEGTANIEKFKVGEKYGLYVDFNINEDYILDDNVKVVANENPDEYTILKSGVVLYYTVKKNKVINNETSEDNIFNLNISSVGTKNIKISWNKVEGAKGYIVYSSTNGKKWKKLTTTKKNTVLSYNNKKLKPGTKYYYKVVAYKVVKKKNKNIVTSKVINTKTVPLAPKAKIKSNTYNSITVNTGKVTGASKYIVERSIDKKTYEVLAELTKAGNYTDKELTTGTKYYYRVRACNERCSGYSKVVNAKPSLKKPGIKVTSGKKKATVKITTVAGADGYVIEKSTKKNKGFKEVTSVDSITKTYTEENLKSKKTFYYRIRAYKLVNEKRVYSGYSKVVKVKIK